MHIIEKYWKKVEMTLDSFSKIEFSYRLFIDIKPNIVFDYFLRQNKTKSCHSDKYMMFRGKGKKIIRKRLMIFLMN